MVLTGARSVPRELETHKKEGKSKRHTYTFPICGDVVRRLMGSIEDLEIDFGLQRTLAAVAERQTLLLSLAQKDDVEDMALPAKWHHQSWDKLFPYQRVGAVWLLTIEGGILSDEQGTGKTITSLAAAEMSGQSRGIVICSGAKVDDWVDHAKEWTSMSCVALTGTAGNRARILEQWTSGILVLNYKVAYLHQDELLRAKSGFVIIDEAHNIRNRKNETTGAIVRIAKKAKYRWPVTATISVNYTGDIWTLLNIVDPERFGSYWSFVYRFCDVEEGHFGLSVGDLRDEETENLTRLLSVYTISRAKSGLPGRTRRAHDHHLEGEHRELYEAFDRDDEVTFDGQVIRAETPVSKITRLRQLALHPGLVFGGYEGPSKLDSLVDVLEERPGQAVVFMNFAELADLTVGHLLSLGITAVAMHSNLSKKMRDHNLSLFRSGDARVLAITHKTGGEGLNLTEADRVIFLDLAWHPAGNQHAQDRVYRIGQTKDVEVILIRSVDTIEGYIWEIVRNKERVSVQKLMRRMKEG